MAPKRKTRSSQQRTPSSKKGNASSGTTSSPKATTPKRSSHPAINVDEEDDEEFLNDQTTTSSTLAVGGNTPSTNKSYEDAKQWEAMRARLALLERDNYFDRKGGSAGKFSIISGGDDEEGVWDTTNDVTRPKNKSKKKKKDTSEDVEPSSKKKKTESKDSKKKSAKFVRRKLDHVLLNMDKVHLNSHPNYFSIEASPSIYPPRKFCYTTGFLANYTCPHTGKHFINIPAYEHIKKDFQLE
ncbi:hypothetical protein C9374_000008 [Naegleria lovaniensis]|uniref:Vps72/YL1 C-terminal domain-containing protein n=1 Tax=Naegleria lovaniensis TaxID=51637 RepID=A0AA88KNZ0_NAELO|nr:uncharacterized protein C9374_000008 [Naegleria lovaniensis]KAG2388569.1 hypothetical protein C9374_000008 [Naegleria lovaniensis]